MENKFHDRFWVFLKLGKKLYFYVYKNFGNIKKKKFYLKEDDLDYFKNEIW